MQVEMLDFIDDDTAAPESEVLPAASARLRPCRPKCSQSLGSYKKGRARYRRYPIFTFQMVLAMDHLQCITKR